MTIIHVEPAVARSAFQFASALIEKAAAPTPETPASLLQLVEERSADMWMAGDDQEIFGVAFTQVLQRPKDTVYNILAAAGHKGHRWIRAMRRTLSVDARRRGADKAIMLRVTGNKAYFGMKPAGYYYEDVINVR